MTEEEWQVETEELGQAQRWQQMQPLEERIYSLGSRLRLQQMLVETGRAIPRTLCIIAEGYQREAHALLAEPCTPDQRARLRALLVEAACLEAEAAR